MNEVEVLERTHRFLKEEGPWKQPIKRLFTDAHPTLIKETKLKPFQRFTLNLGGSVVFPDLVGLLSDGESLMAVEAKGSKDIIKGIAQAEIYRQGFHFSFLAADTHALKPTYISIAKEKNIGLIAVSDRIDLLHHPVSQLPRRDLSTFIARQMSTVVQVTGQQTYQYNIPTHYLVWSILLNETAVHATEQLDSWSGYPMPKHWQSALRGAQKLGLVRIHGKEVALTHIGAAAKAILPDLDRWSEIHRIVSGRNPPMLAQVHPPSGALLKILLLHDSMVDMVVNGLENFAQHTANFLELAKICDALDPTSAPIFFLKPESAARLITEHKGHIPWNKTLGEDFRSAMFLQYKRILQHAGILAPTMLGGISSKNYDPTRDIWQLL